MSQIKSPLEKKMEKGLKEEVRETHGERRDRGIKIEGNREK
jgi:hypothetical protein